MQMIKFFRNIRQKLLLEGKTAHYLKYAIGEIVLVVIGILIALQVNNWNGSNKEKMIEQIYLKNLLNDLNDQKASLEVQIKFEQSYLEASGAIIKAYEKNRNLVLDSVFFRQATILTSRKTFVITDATYTDLISSGNINLINDRVFKDKLIKYYQELKRIEKVIQNNNSLLVDQNYISVYNKYGYYYLPNADETVGVTNEANTNYTIPKYQIELQELSKKIISKDENKLAFMNALYLRNVISFAHLKLIKSIESSTQALISELEHINND